MHPLPFALLATLLQGCWRDYQSISFDELPFRNDYVQTPGGRVRGWEPGIDCPDGQKARFYLVYDERWTDPAPVAILLHSGALDYVLAPPSTAAPLDGPHYAPGFQDDHRLSQAWSVLKVWETMGMYGQMDPSEQNLGTLPAALLDDGIATLYPANCWGDLWHNDTDQPNDQAAEYILRYGRTFAWWMVQLATDPSFRSEHDVTLPVELDPSSLYLVGLGNGSRGVAELLLEPDMPAVSGVLLDSPLDDLSPWADPSLSQFSQEREALSRIFRYDPEAAPPAPYDDQDWATYWVGWSLRGVALQGGLDTARIAMAWSDADPQVPQPAEQGQELLDAFSGLDDGMVYAIDTGASGHVFTNSDDTMARELVDFLRTGRQPDL